MSKRGSWPQRLICKRKGHEHRAYRVYRVIGGGTVGVLEPHCERCQKDFAIPAIDPSDLPDPRLGALRNVPEPGGLPPHTQSPSPSEVAVRIASLRDSESARALGRAVSGRWPDEATRCRECDGWGELHGACECPGCGGTGCHPRP